MFRVGGTSGQRWGWTEPRRRLHAQLAERNALLAEYYASAIYFLSTPEAPARMSHLAHAVRELCLHLPDAVGVVKLDRSQSDARSAEFIKRGKPRACLMMPPISGFAVRLAATFRCACFPARSWRRLPVWLSPTVFAATSARRAALMIAEPHAPGGHTPAERDPTVRRWNRIIDDTFFPFVHAFDKRPAPVTEEDLHRDFAFLEEVMRGVLAPLEHVAELDELLAETKRQPEPPKAEDSAAAAGSDAEPVSGGATERPRDDGEARGD